MTFCYNELDHRNLLLFLQLEQMDLPDVWQRRVFLCQVFIELSLDADCLAVCETLMNDGLQESAHLRTQRALALRNLRGKVLKRIERPVELDATCLEGCEMPINYNLCSQAPHNAVFRTRVIRSTVQRDLFVFISPPLVLAENELREN